MNSTLIFIGIVMICIGVTLYINLNLLNKLNEKLETEKKRLISEINKINCPENEQENDCKIQIPSFTTLTMLEELRI